MSLKLADLWRISTVRLLPLYGALFLVWAVLLVVWVQWDTSRYLTGVVDDLLEQRAHYLASVERSELPAALAQIDAVDLRNVMFYGLFDSTGRSVSGNVDGMPSGLVADGAVHLLDGGVRHRGETESYRARGMAIAMATGETLVIARATSVQEHVDSIIYRSLLWALSLTIIPGVIGGVLLARRPLKRIRSIEAAVQPIMRGNLQARLPVSPRRDELDLLAGIVNTMLEEIERLMGEVKGVCDSIAHDLRTPLTRLRSQLHRLQRSSRGGVADPFTVDDAIRDVDSLLDRFRALLRISELEDMHRRAGFVAVDLSETLQHVREIYAPLAEDGQIRFTVDSPASSTVVQGDPHLLLEAISNVVDNALKFTPSEGSVVVRLVETAEGPRIDVTDTCPGINVSERSAVLQRFYRGQCSCSGVAGFGLGLSIVAAIVKLHGFALQIDDAPGGGAWISLLCRRDTHVLAEPKPVSTLGERQAQRA
ncbi:MAG: HAMP domain-containing sensor histidine kinase [Steroidobacteraceae bacterium]